MGFLSSNNNAILVNNCQNLQNLTVTLQVTQDLITLGNTGFSMQVNSYPQTSSKSQGQTLNWFQYIIYVGGPVTNGVGWEIQYWSVGAQSYAPNQPWPPSYTPNPPNTTPWLPVLSNDYEVQGFGSAPSNQILAGSVMQIQLTTDSSGNVTAAAFSVTDPAGKVSNAKFTFPAGAVYPIYGFQVDLVGPGGGAPCTFTSGAGTLTCSVSAGTLAVQNASTGCGGPQPGTAETSNAVYGDITPASGAKLSQSLYVPALRSFQTIDGYQHIFVLGTDGNLWLEQPPFGTAPPQRVQVDGSVSTFQPLSDQQVLVLGRDGKLWLEQAPFGKVPPSRVQVDGSVQAFQGVNSQTVLVLGDDGNLWQETAPFGKVPPSRVQVDAGVNQFSEVAQTNYIFVLGNDGNLWLEEGPFGKVPPSRQQVDASVRAFAAVGLYAFVWVLGTNGNLWLEFSPFGNVPPSRVLIDSNVLAFQVLDLNDVLVLRNDGTLWLEQGSSGTPTRTQIDANVMNFFATDTQNVLVLGSDGNLWWEQAPFGQQVPPQRKLVDASVA